MTIRSWASDSQISHGSSPGYLSGTVARSTSAPTPSAISPTAEDSPPAPQSVIAVQRWSAPVSTSIRRFSVTGSPICTLAPATWPVLASIVRLENVAPRIPSRPVRPPSTTTRSPGCGPVGGGMSAASPMQPQNTSGLVVKPGS